MVNWRKMDKIFKRKGNNMKKQIIIALVLAIYTISKLTGQGSFFSIEDVTAYIERFKNNGFWQEGRSSVLIERNKPETEYELNKIWDRSISTTWAEGAAGAGIGEYVTIEVRFLPSLFFEDILSNIKIEGKLQINNGFCRSEKLFKDNNRVKKALITIYAVPLRVAQTGTFALKPGPMILKEFEIHIDDTNKLQVFNFDTEIQSFTDVEGSVDLFLRLTILEIYYGEKYNDTCISELHATAEIGN